MGREATSRIDASGDPIPIGPPIEIAPGSPALSLLGRLRILDRGRELDVCRTSQRLVAYVALRPEGVARDLVAGVLWPDSSEQKAHTCLRAALSRLAHAAPQVISAGPVLRLDARLTVDFPVAQRLARQLLWRFVPADPEIVSRWVHVLSEELLPGWYEDWAMAASEAWRQLRLHALESLTDTRAEHRRYGEAAAAASVAIAGDPLRETSRAALIRVHLAEGNQSEAVREFGQYRRLLRSALNLEPSTQLRRLVPAFPQP